MNAETQSSTPTDPAHGRRLRRWFLGGFLLVFTGMLLGYRVLALSPTGDFTMQIPLWRYYVICVPRLFSTQELGPSSSLKSMFWTLTVQHTLISLAGGGLSTAFGRLIGGIRRSKQ